MCLQKLKGEQGIELAGLVRIRFEEGQASYEPLYSLTKEQRGQLEILLNALRVLPPLPPLDFVVTLAPSFDRPLLLQATTIPIFARSKEKHNQKVVLFPHLGAHTQPRLIPWEEKMNKALWRGSPTDGLYTYFDWDCRLRARIALLSCRYRDLLDAGLTQSPLLNMYMTDWLTREGVLASPLIPDEQTAYKYLLSLDGKSTPSSFRWQLLSQSLIFKAESNRIEWFYRGLVPGQHYLSFSDDILEKIHWAQTHDEEAKAIAQEAYAFALELDDKAYLYHLLQAYSQKHLAE
ncbi:MAG: hypothetical protein KGJ02_08660 [Verrucomicrobiota bacterium]|nr:hypothetical protein [Verrucomicrobiota bacterium]